MTRSRPIIPRNNPVAVVSRTASWRWAWAAAQVTPVLFSSYVWLIIGTLQPLLMVALLAAAVVLIAVRNTTFGLWWRYGASRLEGGHRDRVAAAIVPVASLPCLWVGRRMPAALVALPSDSDLVVEPSGELGCSGRLHRLAGQRCGGARCRPAGGDPVADGRCR